MRKEQEVQEERKVDVFTSKYIIQEKQMFDYLFSQYKLKMYDKSIIRILGDMQLYEKILLFLILLGSIVATVFALLNFSTGALVSALIMVMGMIIYAIIQNKREEKIRISNEILEPRSKQRTEKMLSLLENFEIDFSNDDELEALINYAKAERDKYDVWRNMRKAFKGLSTYILIPIITIFITELFKDVDKMIILSRAIVLIFIVAITMLSTLAFATIINDIFNAELKRLDRFIDDIKEIKVFRNKANTIAKKKKLENTTLRKKEE